MEEVYNLLPNEHNIEYYSDDELIVLLNSWFINKASKEITKIVKISDISKSLKETYNIHIDKDKIKIIIYPSIEGTYYKIKSITKNTIQIEYNKPIKKDFPNYREKMI